MDLLQFLVMLCVLMGVHASRTTSLLHIFQNQVTPSTPPESEYKSSLCNSNENSTSFVLQPEFKQWFEALTVCHKKGWQLAVPRSPQEARALGRLLFQEEALRHQPSEDAMIDALFVGIQDIARTGKWRTLDGSLLSEAGFDLWMDGGEGDCGALLGDGRYVRQPCHSRLRFACELPRGGGSARREAAGYVEVGDAGRFRLYEKALPWALAREKCETVGGALAVPASGREAGLLAGVFFTRAAANARLQQRGFFVGVTDVAHEGDWRTVAGQTLVQAGYDSWKSGQPLRDRRENCGVLLKDGRYAAHSCLAPMPYCCQENAPRRDAEDHVVTRGHYRLHKKPLPWFDALQACLRENATLASGCTKERQFLKNLMCRDESGHYGNCANKVRWIHVAVFDFTGEESLKNIFEQEELGSSNNLKRRLDSDSLFDGWGNNGYDTQERNNYDVYDDESNNDNFRVSNRGIGKCVQMEYDGTFTAQPCSNELPYVCKSSE